MCGILLRVSNTPLSKPTCIPELLKEDVCDVWDASDCNTISSFVQLGEKLTPLTSQQKNKLDNLDKLRDLSKQISKVKNNVKLSREAKEKQLAEIQGQLDEISKEKAENNDDDERLKVKRRDINELIYKVSNRGPDYISFTQFEQNNSYFQTFSAILSLRQPFTKQPIVKDQFVLQFNGELYNEQCLESNDTQFIMDLLHLKLNEKTKRRSAILSTLSELNGEWAIILVDLVDEKVYFGRDPIGKRSLCFEQTPGQILISSNSSIGFQECRNEIYEYDINSCGLSSHKVATVTPQPFETLESGADEEESILVEELYKRLKKSVKIRQVSIHPLFHLQDQSVLAVLFSGGLDCTIITKLICEVIKEDHSSLDLLTVGFENPRTLQTPDMNPDRKLATKSWFHLSKMFPGLKINLVEINVDYKSWLQHKSRVRELMYPCNTEMDLSIAIAFYFASSTIPELTTSKRLTNHAITWEEFLANPDNYIMEHKKFISSSKVLFSGLGADELFAGYSRHEAIFNTINPNNYRDLAKSLSHDIDVIHERNLGRDDRVMSCWGKELRYPFLDQDFVNWVISSIPPSLKFKYTMVKDKKGKDRISPIRKYILRKLAEQLDMLWVSQELKRAIQFGAKSAKLEIGQNKSKGTDIL
ncbi:hypothetical protein KGF56_002711 [Candida oxycetoniae]|uniref:Glutamine amidotransferase type-2 domain-containing protein n=1 Tax=Candida oxycetoniae TaxID=497107 RepID=A0AAI9SWQ9_9ASCO|nr:uncharacterized protein KGF56_002711 [Candida oxycetoniae]KAI3404519.2 hypothetical protein KGF56_002711 [Candida oxycetoniae]